MQLLNINGEMLSMKQASELEGAASYAAIVKRCQTWRDRSDLEIVFTKMVSKSGAGRRGARNSAFNNGNQRP